MQILQICETLSKLGLELEWQGNADSILYATRLVPMSIVFADSVAQPTLCIPDTLYFGQLQKRLFPLNLNNAPVRDRKNEFFAHRAAASI